MSLALPRESVAIYCRLSRDDGLDSESSSISSQKELLQDFCAKHNFIVYKTYVDDGYTGTNFDRPSFQELIKDIKDKKVNIVITKDLSRLGRNYVLTGYYTDYFFPENNVRYIALNDNIDTKVEDNSGLEFAPFKNVINEWYAKDISKKIRATLHLKQSKGEIIRTGAPLYGYKYDKDNNISIDEVSSNNVKFIFNEYIKGTAVTKICKMLKENKQYSPGYYYHIKYGHRIDHYKNMNEEQKYTWSEATINRIIDRKDYLGYYITSKRTKISFKIKKIVTIPEDQRNFFKNKRPQIITQEVFDLAQKRKNTKIKVNETSKESLLYGILQCKCGHFLRYRGEQNYNKMYREPFYHCVSKKDKKIEYHINVPEKDIMELLMIELQKIKKIIELSKDDLLEYAASYEYKDVNKEETEKALLQLEEQSKKMDYQIQKLFEEHLAGNIPSSTYQNMMKKYTSKKDDIDKQALDLKGQLTPNVFKQIDNVTITKNFINHIINLDLTKPLIKETIMSIFKTIVISKVNVVNKRQFDYQVEFNYNLPEGIIEKYEKVFEEQQ